MTEDLGGFFKGEKPKPPTPMGPPAPWLHIPDNADIQDYAKAAGRIFWNGCPPGLQGTWGDQSRDGNRPTEKPKAGTVSAKQLDSAVLYKFLGSTSSLRQLEMMLDRQRMLWFESPGGFGDANITDPELGKRLGWIYRILDARVGAKVADNFPVAVGIHQEAWAAYTNYIDGRDYFGRRKNFVPTFALKTYLDQLEKSSAALKKIESNAASLYQAAEQNQSIVAGGKLAIQDAAETRTYLANRINRINDEDIKGNILPRLNSANKACEDLQKELDPKLATLEAQVKEVFGLQPKAFLNALSTMAFQITDSHGGPVQAFAQAGNLALEASANILDNSGNLVEKRYVVGAIKSGRFKPERRPAGVEQRLHQPRLFLLATGAPGQTARTLRELLGKSAGKG